MDEITGFNQQMSGFFDRIKKLNRMPKLQRAVAVNQMKMNALKKSSQNKNATKQMIIRLVNSL